MIVWQQHHIINLESCGTGGEIDVFHDNELLGIIDDKSMGFYSGFDL